MNTHKAIALAVIALTDKRKQYASHRSAYLNHGFPWGKSATIKYDEINEAIQILQSLKGVLDKNGQLLLFK